jgi:acetylglutamate kinase
VSLVRVYKVGGPALEDPELLAPLAREVGLSGGSVVLVHGGGRQIEKLLKALGIESRFVDGRRVTSPEAMEVVEMVLSGSVNKALAGGLTRHGIPAVGISGRDANTIRVQLEPELGRVGRPEHVQTELIESLWSAGLLPVIAPVSSGPDGEAVNVNADEAAQAVALALKAASLVYLSDVDGVRIGGETVTSLKAREAKLSIEDGTIAGGMALKVQVALNAVGAGIGEVFIAGKARLLGQFPGTQIMGGAS